MDKKTILNKKGKALDNLLDKLDSQLNAEKTNKKANRNVPLGIAGAITGIGTSTLGQRGAGKTMNPFGSPTLRSINPPKKARADPLNFKRTTKAQARALQKQAMINRHSGGSGIPTGANDDPPDELDVDLGNLNDLKDVDDSKLKTMDWTEPDGTKTTLKFDEDGTLIGKEKEKRARPSKRQQDLKDKLQVEEDKAVATLRSMQQQRAEEHRSQSLRQGVVGGGF